MIVKNEAHVIREGLDSVSPHISSWSICDTGSTDGTRRVIAEYFRAKGIPGELREHSWKNFGHNRTEALRAARGKGDYIWVMDADDLLHGKPDFRAMEREAYMLRFGPDLEYWRQQIFKDGPDWRYVGVVHEYPALDRPYSLGQITGDYHLQCRHIGARSRDPEKYRKDAALLEEALKAEPGNTRYWFYLGQSWYSARRNPRSNSTQCPAMSNACRRTTAQGWPAGSCSARASAAPSWPKPISSTARCTCTPHAAASSGYSRSPQCAVSPCCSAVQRGSGSQMSSTRRGTSPCRRRRRSRNAAWPAATPSACATAAGAAGAWRDRIRDVGAAPLP